MREIVRGMFRPFPRACVGLAALLLLAGCLPTSLNPLYTDKDIVFDPALVGTWAGENSPEETWTFRADGEKKYKLVLKDEEGKSGEFEVHLLKLGGQQFLDLFPGETGFKDWNKMDTYKIHFIPAHSFLKVERITPDLEVSQMDLEWLQKFLQKRPSAIKHEVLDGRIVFTAPTRELQKFVVKHLKTAGAFGEVSKLRRKPATESPAKPRTP